MVVLLEAEITVKVPPRGILRFVRSSTVGSTYTVGVPVMLRKEAKEVPESCSAS